MNHLATLLAMGSARGAAVSPPLRVGINGFGRMGRLALRAGWGRSDLEFVHVNEVNGGPGDRRAPPRVRLRARTLGDAHRERRATGSPSTAAASAGRTRPSPPASTGTASGVDLVLECSGRFRTGPTLAPHLERGARKVVVAAPVKDGSALNIVVGVNDDRYDPAVHSIVTAASCTTNCLAPVVKVLHEGIGISHGSITTLHDLTNTQTIVDAPHKDLRRARAAGMSLIPTTTGSATAIGLIFPELAGPARRPRGARPAAQRLAHRLRLRARARATTVEEVNGLLRAAADGPLAGILGYEERPLVSVDYVNDPRSSIVDALSTMVVAGTQAKVYAWYDNEWGYANRLVELAAHRRAGASRALMTHGDTAAA